MHRRSHLVVNECEARQVRQIFDLYLQHGSLLKVVAELATRGWRNKQWTTRKSTRHGGKVFSKTSLHKLLTNPTYLGKVKYKQELHEGQHDGIVCPEVWQQVQSVLIRNSRNGGANVRNRFGALLKGLLRCTHCDCAMVPSHTTRGTRRYRYYVCSHAQKHGWDSCPAKSVPAGEMEKFVVGQIRSLGTDSEFLRTVEEQLTVVAEKEQADLADREHIAVQDVGQWDTEIRRLAGSTGPGVNERLAASQERLRSAQEVLTDIRVRAAEADVGPIDTTAVEEALRDFDPVWEALSPREQEQVLKLLVQRVDYDGRTGQIAITFRPDGFDSFLTQFSEREVAA